jgi:uncharacterized Zn-finger protein
MPHYDPETAQACTKRHEQITAADLPLSCPPRDQMVWNVHPRVYLPIETQGEVLCPYCGTRYRLKDFDPIVKAREP